MDLSFKYCCRKLIDRLTVFTCGRASSSKHLFSKSISYSVCRFHGPIQGLNMCTRKDDNKPPPTSCCRASLSKHFFSKSTSNQSTVYTDFTSRCLHAKTIIHQRQPHLDRKLYCQVLRLERECLRNRLIFGKFSFMQDTYSFLNSLKRRTSRL